MTSIPFACFQSCKQLKKVVLTENITKLETGAFLDCPSLSEINLPNSLTYIGERAFQYNQAMLYLLIPPNVNYIGPGAFGNTNKNLVINTSLNTYCYSSDGMLIINQQTVLSEYFGSDSKKDLHVPSTCNKINAYAFQNKQLKSMSFDTNPSLDVESSAFQESTIQSFSFPSGLKSIKQNAFLNCKSLISVTFPQDCKLSIISSNCFQKCNSLSVLTLPPSIRTIGSYAFCGCKSIRDIGLQNTQLVSIGTKSFYQSSLRTAILPSTVTSIDISAFEETSLTSFSTSCRSIPDGCCLSSPDLSSVTLSEGVELIGQRAFESCNIDEILLPKSISVISEFCFSNNELLSKFSISVNSSLSEVRSGCFVGCPLLKKITLFPDEGKLLFGNGALMTFDQTKLYTFLPSSDIRTFVVPMMMKYINPKSFFKCDKLVRVLFNGNYINTIGSGAFMGCKNLNFIFVSSPSIENIGTDAFSDCPNLEKCGTFSIPNELKSLFLSKGVKSISLKEDCVSDCRSVIANNYGHFSITQISVFISMIL
ncbi:surface antigen BspA-like [Trichomonas vaginalis G3]|uniref:Surface antigen BspA-like n=1 Tax=Trichomonas vaginalis (strain ATCC PRA-98 / G3) TaxID=412133 RepID=A2ENF1_TRIV3|nr:structural constituent of cell wall [Trichomonas vaginalis G3]EAY05821.1 surface antigen BspA-like [Trichomonas vaginalis G3]KAI5516373.1 structural constituent of cell wall [Trichomonas vaginalis G3]|eukprot:XP_001318044.1 surface antigen BspA-like [Trichomonas vaginalis G3]